MRLRRRLAYLVLAKPRFTSHAELEVCETSIFGIHEESAALLTIQASSLSLILFPWKLGIISVNPDPLNQHTANHAHSRSIQSRIPARRRRPAERASVRPTCQVEVPICAAATAAAAAVQYAFQSSAVCLSACHAGRDSRQAGGHGPGQNLCSPYSYFDSSRKRSNMIKAAQNKCLS